MSSIFVPSPPSLLTLSDEILLLILSHLPSLSLVRCSLSCTRLANLTRDKKLLANISLKHNQHITSGGLKQFLSPGPHLSYVRKLNLSSVYWLQSSLVAEQVIKLKNLTHLYIVDTRLTNKQMVRVLSKLTQLQYFSFTWCYPSKAEVEHLTDAASDWGRLKELSIYLPCDQIEISVSLDLITWVLALCTDLRDLVIFSDELPETATRSNNRYNLTVNMRTMNFPHIKRLIIVFTNNTLSYLLAKEFMIAIIAAVPKPNIQLEEMWCNLNTKVFCNFNRSWCSKSSKLVFRGRESSFRCNAKLEKAHLEVCDHTDVDSILDLNLSNLVEMNIKLPVGETDPHELINRLLLKEDLVLNLSQFLVVSEPEYYEACDTQICIVRLKDTKFTSLVRLAAPLCMLLEEDDEEVSNEENINKRIAHDQKTNRRSNNQGLLSLAGSCPLIDHLEVVQSCLDDKRCTLNGDKFLQAVPKFRNLKVLVIAKIPLNVTLTTSLFENIFKECSKLSKLLITQLCCNPQRLLKDLSMGLVWATYLTILRVEQTQVTQFSPMLLPAIKTGCPILQQLVLIDPSRGIALPRYPIHELLSLATEKDLQLLYICSQLFTIDNVKMLKSCIQKLIKDRPYLVAHFQSDVWSNDPTESCLNTLDLGNIPGLYLDTICHQPRVSSSIGNITFNDIF